MIYEEADVVEYETGEFAECVYIMGSG